MPGTTGTNFVSRKYQKAMKQGREDYKEGSKALMCSRKPSQPPIAHEQPGGASG